MSQNRRKFIRIDAGRAPCEVSIGPAKSEAYLVNESIYGLCVGGLDLMFLAADQQVVVEYENERIVGRCRSASKEEDGRFQVGILKTDEDSNKEINRVLINSYMDFGGVKIVCIPLGIQSDGQVRIRLIDGKEFTVARSKIIQMSRGERLAELDQDVSALGRLLQIYSALTSERNWSCVDDILTKEFGPSVPDVAVAGSSRNW